MFHPLSGTTVGIYFYWVQYITMVTTKPSTVMINIFRESVCEFMRPILNTSRLVFLYYIHAGLLYHDAKSELAHTDPDWLRNIVLNENTSDFALMLGNAKILWTFVWLVQKLCCLSILIRNPRWPQNGPLGQYVMMGTCKCIYKTLRITKTKGDDHILRMHRQTQCHCLISAYSVIQCSVVLYWKKSSLYCCKYECSILM